MRPLRLVALALCVTGSLCLTGCPKSSPQGEERLSKPANGVVRLIPAKVKESAEIVHWQWSLLGERNWITPSVTDTTAALAEVYPLNDKRRTGGCYTWLCDVIFTRQSGESWGWELRLHGSNGKTATAKGVGTGTPQILVPKDQDTALPATVELAKLGEKTLSLTVPK